MKTRSAFSKKEKRQAVTTVTQCRVPVFLPVKQLPRHKKGENITIETAWGSITFKNAKLTQVHRNILDCIFTYYRKRHEYPDGSVGVLVSLREIQKKLGITENHHKWLVEKLEELRATPMEVRNREKGWVIGTGIIRKYKYSKVKREDNRKNLFGDGYLFGIIFENEYMQIFRDDMNMHTAQLTQAIINLNNAFLQALVRLCMSHRKVNMKIEDAFRAIGINIDNVSPQYKRERKRELMQAKEKLQAEFGITVTDTHVFYTQHPQIWFENPKKKNRSRETGLIRMRNWFDTEICEKETGLIRKFGGPKRSSRVL